MKDTNFNLDGEIQIYDAIKDLSASDIEQTVKRNAEKLGLTITDEHLDVINTLIEHYKDDCYQRDCHSGFQHMQFLKNAYETKGGSKYLYHLFDQGQNDESGSSGEGVITLIHELAELPHLTNNVDPGLGTVI